MRQYSSISGIRLLLPSEKARNQFQNTLFLFLTCLSFFVTNHAQALPTFARQTGQSCVACHAGGQFPELTPYGRIFKLTGYTIGTQGNPFSGLVLAEVTQNKNNIDSATGTIVTQNNTPIIPTGSVFIAGKLTDNIGGFAQITYNVYDHQDTASPLQWRGRLVSDNTDLRYVNRSLDSNNDLILGITVNNNPSVQDVWNSSPGWNFPYVSSSGGGTAYSLPKPILERGFGSPAAGVGGYVFWNKSLYAEITGYQTANGFWKFLSQGYKMGSAAEAGSPLVYSQGISPYARVAYSHEWKDQNAMIGLIGMNANIYPVDSNNLPAFGPVVHYNDKGIDGQYQYLLEPHTFTSQVRYVRETINDDTAQAYANSDTLNSIFTKVTYVYRNQYGANIAYRKITGSSDSGAYPTLLQNPTASSYSTSARNSPNTKLWTPEVFWLPLQNLRIGLQYNLYTEYLGAASNYDGYKRNASDNNSAYLYAWVAF